MSRTIREINGRPDHKFQEGDYVREKDSDDDTYYKVLELSYRGFGDRWEYTLIEVTVNDERETEYPTLRFHEDDYELAPICPNCEEYHSHDVSSEYDDENRHYRCETKHCDVDIFKVEPAETITYDDDSHGGDDSGDGSDPFGDIAQIIGWDKEFVEDMGRVAFGDSADEAGDDDEQ